MEKREDTKLIDMYHELSDAADSIFRLTRLVTTLSERIQSVEEKQVLQSMTNKSLIDSVGDICERIDSIDDYLESQ